MTIDDAELNPDRIVEQAILKRLTEEKICDEATVKKLRGRIAAGSLTPEDWNLAIELVTSCDIGGEARGD